MTLALRWGLSEPNEAGGFVYFDAVSLYTRNFRGQVTKHPVDGGGRITDHFIKENPIYNISAVISGVDVSGENLLISDTDGLVPFNYDPVIQQASVGDSGLVNKLKRFIPNSIGQFIPDADGDDVTLQAERDDKTADVDSLLQNLLTGKRFNPVTNQLDPYVQVVRLYEYSDFGIAKIVEDLVLTSFVVREDVNTGEGLFCELTLEQVEFVSLERTEIPQNIRASLQGKAAGKSSKGKQDSTVKDVGDPNGPDDTDPLRAAAEEL